MCNYKISKCHVSLLVMSILLIIFSAGGTTDDTDQKIVGDLNLQHFSIIVLVLGCALFLYSLCNICSKK